MSHHIHHALRIATTVEVGVITTPVRVCIPMSHHIHHALRIATTVEVGVITTMVVHVCIRMGHHIQRVLKVATIKEGGVILLAIVKCPIRTKGVLKVATIKEGGVMLPAIVSSRNQDQDAKVMQNAVRDIGVITDLVRVCVPMSHHIQHVLRVATKVEGGVKVIACVGIRNQDKDAKVAQTAKRGIGVNTVCA